MATETHTEISQRLRDRGLRVTSQRRAVLSVFAGPDSGHLTADQVLERASAELPEIARATVYNTLNELARAGILRRLDGHAPVLFDGNPDREHHHFRCTGCGRLFDVEPSGLGRLEVGAAGFEVERTQITFEGRCAECAAKAEHA